MGSLARFVNACLPPGVLLYAMFVSKPGRHDHMWSGVASLLLVWLLYRLYKAFDYEREYNFWSLKIMTALLLFGFLERLVMTIS